MSTIRHIEPGPRMSEATIHGDTVYLAGQIGREGDDIQTQVRTALAEVDRVLALAGSSKSRILQATVWLADIADFQAMNEVWDAWIDPQNPPPRATGESRLAAPGLKFEVIIVAARND